MIIWNDIDDELCSEDGRFKIKKAKDPVNKEHWALWDIYDISFPREPYHRMTLEECKELAEELAEDG